MIKLRIKNVGKKMIAEAIDKEGVVINTFELNESESYLRPSFVYYSRAMKGFLNHSIELIGKYNNGRSVWQRVGRNSVCEMKRQYIDRVINELYPDPFFRIPDDLMEFLLSSNIDSVECG